MDGVWPLDAWLQIQYEFACNKRCISIIIDVHRNVAYSCNKLLCVVMSQQLATYECLRKAEQEYSRSSEAMQVTNF